MRLLVLSALLLLAACHDRRPPAPTAEQSEQLNDTEDMLNQVAADQNRAEANRSAAHDR
ncbi:MAG TPA: hypothetical protein VFM42_01835 [Sphingomicrobium sp.]|jgi:hypothetical protein|nr:hypothetical protein [Sphingomicrobium sp.]